LCSLCIPARRTEQSETNTLGTKPAEINNRIRPRGHMTKTHRGVPHGDLERIK